MTAAAAPVVDEFFKLKSELAWLIAQLLLCTGDSPMKSLHFDTA